MSTNLCPRCHRPIMIPQEEVVIVRTKIGRNRFEDRMAHKVCPTGQGVESRVGGQEYCTNCGHNKTLHNRKCSYTSFGFKCDCKDFRK